ncbi:WXG100 family type VII secretion target [Mycobacteroides abscessus]|uniref:WXG100 family type VII secretion target n=1 Tax=Mycobacteroides abscessus TaxID=36809 RepID=A0ABD7HQN4_9MYCO|nr:hypothetical protein [Mycobacteroides abscessus]AWG65732.1 hypothetical protein DDT46_19310 [Mycobacteroides abscessus]PVA78086.1 hypothetical protein DDJ37_05510 [Mycobacteroides abscessus]PVB19548.1 hypothetical protein DDJ40_07155 [Mycobacteroides abscessus]PVB22563.1 hypothetical protein DDJ45_23370 [Mycobacteroides abscessus]PVB24288.1 hypothetical protein DDJ71_05355 [Mycobacteroides abscessus]
MSETFNVRPEDLHRHGESILDAVKISRDEHAGHHDQIEEASSGWIGESASALVDLHKAWVDQRATLHHQLSQVGIGMQEDAKTFAAMEEQNRGSIGKANPANGGA